MTVEEQIAAWIETSLAEVANLEPSDAGEVREVSEKDDLIFDMPVTPAIHYVFGDTVPAEDSQDNRGYTHNTPLFIKIGVAEHGNPRRALRSLGGIVQQKIETDALIVERSGSGNPFTALVFESSHDFAKEALKPISVRILQYRINHRREIGNPSGNY